jgi:hypothetical protein
MLTAILGAPRCLVGARASRSSFAIAILGIGLGFCTKPHSPNTLIALLEHALWPDSVMISTRSTSLPRVQRWQPR